MDIEGSEYEALASMLAWGSFRFINEIWIERHKETWASKTWKNIGGMKSSLHQAFNIISFAGANVKVLEKDDESFASGVSICSLL